MPSSKTLLAAALGALALTGAGAPAASADSISYVKNGNVWLSTPDGSRQFQVTTTGGYASASQADDGTIAAITGQRIHRLDRYGNVLSNFSTPVSDGTNDSAVPYVSHFVGPFDADISDDGQKVAYSFYWQYWTMSGYTGYHMLRQGVGISKADRLTSWSEPGLGYQTGWLDSSWYDSDTLLLGREASAGMVDISLDNLGTRTSDSIDWFAGNPTLTNLREPAANRQHDRVAFVRRLRQRAAAVGAAHERRGARAADRLPRLGAAHRQPLHVADVVARRHRPRVGGGRRHLGRHR